MRLVLLLRNSLLALAIFLPNITWANSYSLELNGSNQYDLRADTNLNLTDTFTYEAWIKPTDPNTYRWITGDSLTNNSTGETALFLNDTNHLICRTWASSGGFLDIDAGVIVNDTWNHVAFIKNADNDWDCVLNGTAVNSTASRTLSNTNKTGLTVGVTYEGNPDNYFTGLIDELRLWNIARTITELTNNANCSLNGDESGLLGYWQFENDHNDTTANNYDLTAFNSPNFSSTVPFSAVCEGGGEPEPTPSTTPYVFSTSTFAGFFDRHQTTFLWFGSLLLLAGFIFGFYNFGHGVIKWYKENV